MEERQRQAEQMAEDAIQKVAAHAPRQGGHGAAANPRREGPSGHQGITAAKAISRSGSEQAGRTRSTTKVKASGRRKASPCRPSDRTHSQAMSPFFSCSAWRRKRHLGKAVYAGLSES
jgi:hypothetical protein